MKKITFLLIISLLVQFNVIAQSRSSSDVYVKGYVRKDGTVVPGHYRSAPNSTNRDNFSTKGNVNPYTGVRGHIDPDNKRYNYSTNSTPAQKRSVNSTRYYGNSYNNGNTITTVNESKKTLNKASKINAQPYIIKSVDDTLKAHYFYALEKRWLGLENNIKFGIGYGNSYKSDQWISLNIGIKTDGGGLVMVNCGDMDEIDSIYDRYKVVGTLIFYLENGEIIKCFDRKLYERKNKTDYSFYYLTRKEVHLLEENNISAIEFSVYFDYDGSYPRDKTLKFLTDFFITGWKMPEQTQHYISKLFDPYWSSRITSEF
jgi:hypothetical protein